MQSYAILTAVYDASEFPRLLAMYNRFCTLELRRFTWLVGLKSDFSADIPSELLSISNIRFIVTNDSSIYESLNVLISNVKEDWFICLGAGDRFSLLFDEEIVVSELERSSDYWIVYGNSLMVDDNYNKIKEISNEYIQLDNFRHGRPRMPAHSEVFHRTCIDGYRVQFSEDYRICSDYFYMCKCVSRRKHRFIPFHISEFISGGISQNPNYLKVIDGELMSIYSELGIRIPLKQIAIRKMIYLCKIIVFNVFGVRIYERIKAKL